MKIVKFLLTIIYVYFLSSQSSIADDAKMKNDKRKVSFLIAFIVFEILLLPNYFWNYD